jgi:hypothetical protein
MGADVPRVGVLLPEGGVEVFATVLAFAGIDVDHLAAIVAAPGVWRRRGGGQYRRCGRMEMIV